MDFLRFSLHLINFVAWPVVALVYPICASIRAIESGSKYHMRKLVIYWTIFSFISLFQHLFHKLIQWVPLWPHIKLIAICWLVIPQFNNACYLYQILICPCFLVKWHHSITQFNTSCYVCLRLLCLCLSVNLQTVTDWFNKPMEDQSLNNESFLAVVERYLEENGSDALEKLIAHKYKDYSSNHHAGEIKPTDKAGGLTPNQTDSEGSGPVWEDITVMENMAKHEAAEPKQVKSVKEIPIQIEKRTVVQIKETAFPADAKEIKLPETNTVKEVAKKWICAVCQVTTTSEHDLKCHLLGRRHKEKREELNSCKRTANTEKNPPFTSIKETAFPADAKEIKLPGTNTVKEVAKKWICAVCQVTTYSEHDLKCHLLGRRHKEKREELNSCKRTANTEKNPPFTSNMPDKLKHKQGKHALAGQKKESTDGKPKEKVQLGATTGQHQRQTQVKDAGGATYNSKLWCSFCDIRCPDEIAMAAHLNGKKHLAKLQEKIEFC